MTNDVIRHIGIIWCSRSNLRCRRLARIQMCVEQGTLLYQAKSTFKAERPLLYELFLYCTYSFDCLTRIEHWQLVTSACALQDNMPRIYERYHAIASRRKLSLLAYGPNPCHFFFIICIMSLLFHIIPIISKIKKCDLGAYSLQKTC